jgi:tetratricopeptide (TPR) repeat protein
MYKHIYNNIHVSTLYILVIMLGILLPGCKKDWLDIKPVKSAVVFTTLNDFQAILDNTSICHSFPMLSELGGDNFFYNEANLATMDHVNVGIYSWVSTGNYIETSGIFDWSTSYKAIFSANLCIEGLDKIKIRDTEWKSVYGNSLFVRGVAFFSLANLFAAPYEPAGPNTSPGLPLRLEPDITLKIGRGTVKQTYEQILNDLLIAADNLPDVSGYKIRPTKTVAYGMLARVYLAMGDYANALLYADKYLSISNTLLNYNTLPSSAALPEPQNNAEIAYYAQLQSGSSLNQNRADINTDLYNSYSVNDLRKAIFFRTTGGRNVWTGSYTASITIHFAGIANDEMYLIRAECRARNGQIPEGMADLNLLLRNRYKTGTYTDQSAATKDEALDVILAERRKELLFRGLRWSDIRRLNKESRYAITVKRTIAGVDYFLTPNDKKLLYPIPDDEILFSGIEQNPR